MKKQYEKPAMRVVLLQHGIICTSPGGYDGRSVGINSTTEIDEEDVW